MRALVARDSPRARSASRPASPTPPACTRATTSWSRSAASSRAAPLLPAPPQLRPARAPGLRRLDRDRAAGRRAAAPRALPPRLRVNRGRAPELLALIDAARADGVDVTLDTYPYLAGATYLHALLPGWAHAGGPDADDRAPARPRPARAAAPELEEQGSDGFHGVPVEWDKLVLDGETIAGSAERDGQAADRRLLRAAAPTRASRASVLVHFGNEENVRTIMQHPAHTAGSDGILVGERPHPRGWGTFARYLAVYVRELGVLSLESASATSPRCPAQRLGCRPRPPAPRHGGRHRGLRPATVRDVGDLRRAAPPRRRASSTSP